MNRVPFTGVYRGSIVGFYIRGLINDSNRSSVWGSLKGSSLALGFSGLRFGVSGFRLHRIP